MKISSAITKKYIDTNKEYLPTRKSEKERLSYLIGAKFYTIENTEITNKTKELLVL